MVSRSIIAEAETQFVLLENIFEKRRDLPFSHKSDCKKEKNMVSFMHEQNIICSQTKLDEIGQEQTSGQFFAGHVVGSLPMKRKIETFASNDKNYYSSSGKNYFLTRMPCFIYFSQTRECPVECE